MTKNSTEVAYGMGAHLHDSLVDDVILDGHLDKLLNDLFNNNLLAGHFLVNFDLYFNGHLLKREEATLASVSIQYLGSIPLKNMYLGQLKDLRDRHVFLDYLQDFDLLQRL